MKADVKQQEIYKRTGTCMYLVSFYKKYLQHLKYTNNFAWYFSNLILSVKNMGMEGRGGGGKGGNLLNGKNLLSVMKVNLSTIPYWAAPEKIQTGGVRAMEFAGVLKRGFVKIPGVK